MTTPSRCLLLLVALCALGTAHESFAVSHPCQNLSDDDRKSYFDLVGKGNASVKEKNFDDAKIFYGQAQDLCPFDPTLSYNLARILHLTEDCQGTLQLYSQALKQVKTGLVKTALTAEKIQSRYDEARELCENTTRMYITCVDEGVMLQIDDLEPQSCPFDKRFKIGTHQLVATLEEHKQYTDNAIELVGGEDTRVRIPALQSDAPPPLSAGKIAGWTSVGVGSALVLTGAALHIVAATQRAQISDPDRDDNGFVSSVTRAQAFDLKQTSDDLDTAGVVTLSIGSAALVTGLVLVLLNDPDEAPAEDNTPAVEPISAVVAPGYWGVSWSASF